MNEQLKELAFESGFVVTPCGIWESEDTNLERFAELVRQDEREACVVECEVQMGLIPTQAWTVNPYTQCIKAIRARGEPSPAFKNFIDDNWAGIV